MTLAAARFGLLGTSEANQREPRQIAALRRATEWLNSPLVSATTLLGKVVLVQFGTYTCINWLRTLPYVGAWDQKYRQGLVVIARPAVKPLAGRVTFTAVVAGQGECK
jgi:hypothetical protein